MQQLKSPSTLQTLGLRSAGVHPSGGALVVGQLSSFKGGGFVAGMLHPNRIDNPHPALQRRPHANERPADPLPVHVRLDDFTRTHVKWFLVRAPDTLKADEQARLTWLCDAHPTLKRLYELVQGFRRVLRERKAAPLHTWIGDCQRSGIGELRQFAKELLR